jgi:hypothetical protein
VTIDVTVPEGSADDFDLFTLIVTSDQGAVASLPARLEALAAAAALQIDQSAIEAYVVRGGQEFVSFSVTNAGSLASGPITVVLPALDWLSAPAGVVLESLAPGATTTVELALTPGADVPISVFQGSLLVTDAAGANVRLPFAFTTAEDAVGALRISVADELVSGVSTHGTV